jgi:vancomycin permeability regulator SanA
MSNISLFKKINFFKKYKKIIKDNSEELSSMFNLRIDSAYRMYTVINIPKDMIGDEYSMRTYDISNISKGYITDWGLELKKYLDSKGLSELYSYYKIEKVDKFSFLVVIGFSLFKSNEYYNNIYYKLIPSLVVIFFMIYYFAISKL